jgi:hypothetical protein
MITVRLYRLTRGVEAVEALGPIEAAQYMAKGWALEDCTREELAEVRAAAVNAERDWDARFDRRLR